MTASVARPETQAQRRVARLEAENEMLRRSVELLRVERESLHEMIKQEARRCSNG
jgi:cell division protein FtsB